MIAGALFVSANLWVFVLAASAIFAHTGIDEPSALDRGGKTFWDYYSEHFVLRLSDLAGRLLFAGLASALLVVAYLGVFEGSAWWTWALIGLLATDWLLSHVGLRLLFPGSNPGLPTSFLYPAIIAIILIVLEPRREWSGLAAGCAPFPAWWLVSFLFFRRKVAP